MSLIKGIFSDANNTLLRYKSEDINKKSLFPKFQLIPILCFQVMYDYVHFIAPIELLCWQDFSVKIALISYWNNFSPTPLGKCASYRSELQICKKKSHFKHFESALYLTSVSIPLMTDTL